MILNKPERFFLYLLQFSVILEQCRLRSFFDLITEVCITYLGLEIGRNTFTVRSDHGMLDDMLVDILKKPTMNSGQLGIL